MLPLAAGIYRGGGWRVEVGFRKLLLAGDV